MKRREFIALVGSTAAWPLAAARGRRSCRPSASWAEHAFELEPVDRCLCATVARTRLDRGAHGRDRVSLGGGAQRALSRDRGRVRSAQGGCHRHGGKRSPRRKAGDIGHPHRLRGGGGPAWDRFRRFARATGGNVTGLSIQATILRASDFELLREVLPGLRRLAIMGNVDYPATVLEIGEVQAGGP